MGRTHTHRLRVRYGECDAQGVVFNANYFAFFDVALTELWREAVGGYTAMLGSGVDMVVARASADFRGAARFDEEIEVEIAVRRMGATSLVTALCVRRDGELLVEGEMVHVFFDRATLAKTPIPLQVREALGG